MKSLAMLLSTIIFFSLLSCSDNDETHSCYKPPSYNKNITFNFHKDTLVTNVDVFGQLPYQYGRGYKEDQKEREKIFHILKQNMPQSEKIDGEIFSYVFYVPGLIDNHKIICMSDIYGISIYYIKNDKFYHALLARDINGSFQFISDLNCETSGLISNFIHTIAIKLLPNIRTKEVSAYQFDDYNNMEYYKEVEDNSKEMLDIKCKFYYQKLKKKGSISIFEIQREDPPESCGNDCDYYIEINGFVYYLLKSN